MNRITLVILVFVAGFGAGYGLTHLLVGGPEAAESPPVATAPPLVATSSSPPVGTADSDTTTITAGDAAATAIAAGATDGAEPPEDTAVAPAADTTVAAQPDTGPAPQVVSWWDACHGKMCRVDFGRVTGGLSVRAGTLEHGADVDWKGDFSTAERIGVLAKGADVVVKVHAVGMTHGLPSAAYITAGRGDQAVTGVVALTIGDKEITFVSP